MKQMQVQIERTNNYKITIGNKTYENFRKCEAWEGMLKFSGPDGTIIVHKEDDMFATFASIFGNDTCYEKKTFLAVKMSTNLIPETTEPNDGNKRPAIAGRA